MSKKNTIKEVAKLADVSVATVSYVINNINKVSEATKIRVQNAMIELNYQPDYSARTLSMKKSNIIGIAFPWAGSGDEESSILHDNPFYSELLSGIECCARRNGYDIMITGIKTEDYHNWINKRNIDGIILLGFYSEEIIKSIKSDLKKAMPIVITDDYGTNNEHFYSLRVDDEGGSYLAVKYLIEKGHIKIAISPGEPELSAVNTKRLEGYRRALEEFGLVYNEELVIRTPVSFGDGKVVGKIVAGMENVTAIFSVADIMAMGIVKGAMDAGKKVPDDIAVVGFDDLSIAKFISPALTTIRQGIFKRGEKAAQIIIDVMNKKEIEEKTIIMPVELVEREST